MIEIRAAETVDARNVSLAIFNTVWPHLALSAAEAESFRSSLRDHFDALALENGVAIGSAGGGIRPQRQDRVFVVPTVLAEHRRRGAGSALYRHISEWADARDVGRIETWVEEDDPDSLDFALRRRFYEIERDSRMILELGSVRAPDVDPPPDVEIVTWAERPEATRGMYEVACEAFPDIPGGEDEQMEPFDDWVEHELRRPRYHPEATFVALAGDEVVGYANLSVSPARPRVAGHAMTAVKRSWRGRGVAGALKRAEIAWAKARGYERLQTTNEVRNVAMLRVNERLGYRTVPGRIFLLGPLSD